MCFLEKCDCLREFNSSKVDLRSFAEWWYFRSKLSGCCSFMLTAHQVAIEVVDPPFCCMPYCEVDIVFGQGWGCLVTKMNITKFLGKTDQPLEVRFMLNILKSD